MPLRVVALRGSVPAQWAADFRTAAGARAHLKLQQRPQLQTIYDELGDVRYGYAPALLVPTSKRLLPPSPAVRMLYMGRLAGRAWSLRSLRSLTSQRLSAPRCVSRKKDSAATADVVTLSDTWLAPAIRAGLLRPVPRATSSRWWVRLAGMCGTSARAAICLP